MKRKGNLWDEIISIENLKRAEKKARRGKKNQKGVKLFDRNPEDNIINLHHVLSNDEYVTSDYTTFGTLSQLRPKEIQVS